MNRIQTSPANHLKEKNPRGGITKPPLEIARVRLWGLEVKSRTSLTYKALDELFLRKNVDQEFDEPPKVFEKIARNGVSPIDTKHRRGLIELVKVVDQHPDFQGTAIVFNSKLWELLELQSIDEADIVKRINNAFIEHGVPRYAFPAQEESWHIGRNPVLDKQPPINSMELINLQNANLHKITWEYLMILLYLSAKTMLLEDQKRVFEINVAPLGKYFEENLGEYGLECADEAFKRIKAMKVMRTF